MCKPKPRKLSLLKFVTFSSGLGSGFRRSFGCATWPAELSLTGVLDVVLPRFSARALRGYGWNSTSQRAHVVRPRNQRRTNLQTMHSCKLKTWDKTLLKWPIENDWQTQLILLRTAWTAHFIKFSVLSWFLFWGCWSRLIYWPFTLHI